MDTPIDKDPPTDTPETLPAAAARTLRHTRSMVSNGYERDDGLWDIEATLRDIKTYSFPNHDRGLISAGSPIHEMHVRVTVDNDLYVKEAHAVTVASPFSLCPLATEAFSCLVGVRIAKGWHRAVIERFGHAKGCTHLTNLLLGPIAQTAHQSILSKRRDDQSTSETSATTSVKHIINTCHALADTSPVIKREWPDYYRGVDNSSVASEGALKDNSKA